MHPGPRILGPHRTAERALGAAASAGTDRH